MNRRLEKNYSRDKDMPKVMSKVTSEDSGSGGGGAGAVVGALVRPTLLSVSSKKKRRTANDHLR